MAAAAAAAAAAAMLGGASWLVSSPPRWAVKALQGGTRGDGRNGYGYGYGYYSKPPPSARRIQWPSSGRPAPSERPPQTPSQDESESWREWDEREAQLEVLRAEGRQREREEREGRRRDGGMKRRMEQQHREAIVRAEQMRLDMERARQLREAKMRGRLSRAAAAPRSRNQAAEFIRDEREVDDQNRRPQASTSYDGFDYYDDNLWPRDTRTGFGRWVAGWFEEPGMREQPVRTSQMRRRKQVGDDPYTAFAARPRRSYVENSEAARRAAQPVSAAGAPRDDDFLDYTPSSSSPLSSWQETEGDAYMYDSTPQQRARYADPRVDDPLARARRKPIRAADETDSKLRFEEREVPSGRRRVQQRRKAPDFESIRAALLGEASPYELFNSANQRR